MAIRPIWKLSVVSKTPVTPHLVRLTLHGDSLAEFPADSPGGYVKLMVPKPEHDGPPEEVSLDASIKRSYTVRKIDNRACTLVLDAVSHDDGGPATAWIRDAREGDRIAVTGPGPIKMLSPGADWVFLAGDMSALPAMSVNLEQLPADTKGHAAIAIHSLDDVHELAKPTGVEVHWVESSPGPDSALVKKVRSLPWLDGQPGVWSASEFSEMKGLRAYFRDERKVDSEWMYISSYWKIGDTDEGHKKAKQVDP